MDNSTDKVVLEDKYFYVSLITMNAITTVLNVIWSVWLIYICICNDKELRRCKAREPDHPIHKGVGMLSKDRMMYNLRTRLVKNILLVLVCSLEIIYCVCIGIYFILLMLSRKQVRSSNMHLICPTIFTYYYYYPSLIVSLNFIWVLICAEQSILLILTRYLIARYQGYPFKRVLFNQIIVFLFQSFIIAISSTIYTIPLSFFAIPIINIVNWVNLKTFTGFLSSVLHSKLEEIKKYHWNSHFFEEQNDAYDWFKLFRVSLLVTYFLMITLSVISSIIATLFYVSFASCFYSKEFNFNPFINLSIESIIDSICQYLGLISNDIISQLISISIGLPVWVFSLSMLAMPIIKRYRYRKQATRFNHSSEREFLIRKGLSDPTNCASF